MKKSWQEVALTLAEACEAMQRARACPMVDDDFPDLLRRADRNMEAALGDYYEAYKESL